MFGLSLTKVLFTIFVVVVVWGAFKYYSRAFGGERTPGDRPSLRDKVERAAQDAVRKRMGAQDQSQARASSGAPEKTEDLVRCPNCGTYSPKGTPCDCGYGR